MNGSRTHSFGPQVLRSSAAVELQQTLAGGGEITMVVAPPLTRLDCRGRLERHLGTQNGVTEGVHVNKMDEH